MKTIFDTKGCAKEMMKILEKYEATPYYADEVFKLVKEEIVLTTPVRAEYATFGNSEEKENTLQNIENILQRIEVNTQPKSVYVKLVDASKGNTCDLIAEYYSKRKTRILEENVADDGKLKNECAFSSDQIARPSESP